MALPDRTLCCEGEMMGLRDDMLTEYLHIIADERERMGFVWLGDMEKDPRYMDGDPRCTNTGRVLWGRSRDGKLHVREWDEEWTEIDEATWAERYPHAEVPARLPEGSS